MNTRYYWWLVTRQDGKDTIIFGSDLSAENARQKGIEILGGLDFEVCKLPTRDLGKASSLWKGRKLDRTHSLKKSTERLRHTIGKPKQGAASRARSQQQNQHDPW